ncbi:MAG: tetratricopeptide repeat protein [Burkholderiales bacterium]|nr:tetratricopeptide repeat protein [Burkholderiales bacterium]
MRPSLLVFLFALGCGAAAALPLGRMPDLQPPQPPAGADSPAGVAYREGLERFAAGDLAAAEQAFRQAAELKHVHALLGLAEIAFRRGQKQEGGRWLQQALRQAPADAHVQASVGRWQASQGHYAEAERALKRAIELDGRLVRPRMDLADLYATALRRPQEAVALYQRVLELDPGHAGAHYALGVTRLKLGQVEAARAALEQAVRLAPDNPLPLLALAQAAQVQGKTQEALQRVDQALKRHDQWAEALELRGDLRLAAGQTRAAIDDYRAAVRNEPRRAGAWIKLGMAQQVAGEPKAAAQSYQEAVRLDPQAAVAYNNLAWLSLQTQGDLGEAETWARKAVGLAPKAAQFHDTLGWILRARGQLAEAEKALARATALPGVTADVYYHLGVVRQELGRRPEALAAYRQALSLDRNHAQAREALRQLESGR